MALDPSKRRYIRLLRRSAKSPPTSAASRTAMEENAFWISHERAVVRTREAGEAAQGIASVVAKQRAAVDSIADRARAVSGRAQELSGIFGRIGEVFERLGLVALNAGLEGARLGESAGRAVLLVSDEVRTHSLRGGENVRELTSTLAEMAQELALLVGSFDGPRTAAGEIAQQAALSAGASADAERALVDIDARMRKATGSDPETSRAIAEASERAHALVQSISDLGGRVPQDVLLQALRPMLEPLVRLVAEEDAGTPVPAAPRARRGEDREGGGGGEGEG
jgi:methyl-accepting chemotaxis protein